MSSPNLSWRSFRTILACEAIPQKFGIFKVQVSMTGSPHAHWPSVDKIRNFLERWWGLLALLAISLPGWFAARRLAAFTNIPNSNFFKIWLAGHLIWTGGNPYSPIDWINGHLAAGSTWIPEAGFLYPLPLAYLLAPFGLLSAHAGYIAWAFLSTLACAAAVIIMVNAWPETRLKVFSLLLLIAVFLFAPALETIGKGTIGAVLLLVAVCAIELFRRAKPFAAGLVFSILLLKPQLGVPILAGIGVWLAARRDWRALAGMATGAGLLFLSASARDIHWLTEFIQVSRQKLGETFGTQPTLFSAAALVCANGQACTLWLGALFSLALTLPIAYVLWRKANELSALQAYNLVAPLGLLITPYLWSYDHVLLVASFVWLAYQLILRTKKYVFAMFFLIAIDLIAGVGFFLTGLRPEKDFWSIVVPLVALLLVLWFSSRPRIDIAGQAMVVHPAEPSPDRQAETQPSQSKSL